MERYSSFQSKPGKDKRSSKIGYLTQTALLQKHPILSQPKRHAKHNHPSLPIPSPRKTNRLTLLPRRLHIQRHILPQLHHLRIQLRLLIRRPLRYQHAQPQHIRLQLQHLILDLAHLQRLSRGGRGASRCDRVVETPRFNFGGLGDLGCFGDDGEVAGGDGGEVGLVDLGRVRGGWMGREGGAYGELCVDFGEGVAGDAGGDLELVVGLCCEDVGASV